MNKTGLFYGLTPFAFFGVGESKRDIFGIWRPVEMACKRPKVMYDSSMRSKTYPLAMPEDLLNDIRETAKVTGLSIADAMRQSMRLGMPKLKAGLSGQNLKPLTPEECKEVFGPDPEWDDLIAAAVKSSATPKPEED